MLYRIAFGADKWTLVLIDQKLRKTSQKVNLQKSLQKVISYPQYEELCPCYKWHQMILVWSQQLLCLQQQTQPGW